MRNTTKTFVASVGMGICAISYAIGANSAAGSSFTALPATSGSTNSAAASNSASNSTSASASASSSSSNSSTAKSTSSASSTTKAASTTKKKKKKTTTSTTKSTSTAKATPSSSASSSASSGGGSSNTTVTKTGAMIQGNDPFGDYAQISVTKVNGKVTAVNVVQSYSNGGRDQVFPYLSQLAVQSNGASVGNYGGATYTSIVFNKALASAMSKF